MSSRRAGDDGSGPEAKRARGEGAGPAGGGAPALDIAAIRAQIAARKAAITGSGPLPPGPPPPRSSSASAPTPAQSSQPVGVAALPPQPRMDASVAERLAAAKARIEAMKVRNQNPYLSGSAPRPGANASTSTTTTTTSTATTKAALPPSTNTSIALHPLLMQDKQAQLEQDKNEKRRERDRYKTMAPKFSTVKANQVTAPPSGKKLLSSAPAPSLNPYASKPAPAAPTADGEASSSNSRRSRKMKLSQPGKYVQQGDELRNELKLEALKQRIAEASRKAGLDSEFDTLERSLKRQAPPELEWWDQAILPPGSSYAEIEKGLEWITSSTDSLVTHLIQHPIPIAAPSDKKQPDRGLMLTKKEQKKMRRQRRKAELEDKRDRQKMGLIPPDPPKVRLANLMKVLTSDAVADPTKMEAKVRREVDMRKQKHEMDNEERKLTTEERKQKEYEQMVSRERRGIYAAAFKIKYLTNGRHKFKVRETAKKDLLSGVCIFHPSFALVLVEGTDKGIKHYRQLMENRIDWTEEARPMPEEDDDEEGEGEKTAPSTSAPTTQPNPESLEDNKCELIWSGEVPERAFRLFRARHAETDTRAKEWLTPRYEGYWDLAKRHVWSGDDF
ncbi:pre-mRNA processing factor 3-domain-containing protein [Kockovaella imperatae]|uniref:Pre-mRNA processing factor 3-domain-containing protein n=1 Tax=Kockovaella imperatae TaxID=4999 RepID=A0A1Y1UE15_9TREE|nr:pre-mRNA processing factor 3-domain-containing protein [Kockovaella imperatae]ORX36283.1 pre-mRNA processing factor 3-domain-containing protein [Kockovaella imperatae]